LSQIGFPGVGRFTPWLVVSEVLVRVERASRPVAHPCRTCGSGASSRRRL